MVHKINKKIVGYKVLGANTMEKDTANTAQLEEVHEQLKRGYELLGTTYKIETSAATNHAVYVTINDMVLNEGTENERLCPYEIFINCKCMENFQWIIALTRLISAIFRKGGNIEFIVEELENIFDPRGGYWKRSKYIPSLVAEIGMVIRGHLISRGIIQEVELTETVKQVIEEKRKAIEENNEFPPSAVLCSKCNHKSMVLLDGCMTCLNCGDSKCG